MSGYKGTRSVLPNSSNAILAPLPHGLQVRWHGDLDLHILYRDEQRIAGHHNGFSCHELATRMLAGNIGRTLAQFDFILACGGKHYITREVLQSAIGAT